MAHRRGEFEDPWTDQCSLFRTGGRGVDWLLRALLLGHSLHLLLEASAGLESMGVGDGIG